MRYHWMLVTMGVAAIAGIVLVTQIADPCAGDLTGSSPILEHSADLERESLSARAAAAMTEAISSCETDATCVTRVTEKFTRFEADALGAKARDQRDALIAACRQKL
jgi:hypothetical protein